MMREVYFIIDSVTDKHIKNVIRSRQPEILTPRTFLRKRSGNDAHFSVFSRALCTYDNYDELLSELITRSGPNRPAAAIGGVDSLGYLV